MKSGQKLQARKQDTGVCVGGGGGQSGLFLDYAHNGSWEKGLVPILAGSQDVRRE